MQVHTYEAYMKDLQGLPYSDYSLRYLSKQNPNHMKSPLLGGFGQSNMYSM